MNNLNKPMTRDRSALPNVGRPAATIINAATKIEGNITSKSEVIIHGVLIGDIQSPSVLIGKQALVTGKIDAKKLSISGQFEGNIKTDHIELKASANVNGEIKQRTITVDSGAQLDVKILSVS